MKYGVASLFLYVTFHIIHKFCDKLKYKYLYIYNVLKYIFHIKFNINIFI